MYSTTQMPKCSFHMVCSPTLARPSQPFSSEYGAFTTNSTCDWNDTTSSSQAVRS